MTGIVYFIGARSGEGLIKIGFSKTPHARLATLQAGSPVELEFIAYVIGDMTMERRFHERHASARQHGEWFKRENLLLEDIQAIKSGAFDESLLADILLPKKIHWKNSSLTNSQSSHLALLDHKMLTTPMHSNRQRDYILIGRSSVGEMKAALALEALASGWRP